MKLFEEQTDSELVYDGRIIKVYSDKVILPDGNTAGREVVKHKGAVAILPVDSEGNAYFVRQFRYPVGREVLEVPAGKLEAGELPLECAKRELREECGLIAGKWTELGPMLSSPGYSNEVIWLFVAEELEKCSQDLDFDEFLNVEKISMDEMEKRVNSGSVMDSKTQICVLRAGNLKK